MPGSRSDVERAWDYLAKRFGVARDAPVLDGLTLKAVAGDVWFTTAEHEIALQVKTYGIRAVRIQDIGLKPTTYLLQFLGDAITENVVTLERDAFLAVLDGELVPCKLEDRGYVALRWDGRVWGCGFYKDGTVSSRIPKGRARTLRTAIEEE